MKNSNFKTTFFDKNNGMTLPELVLAILMLSAFTGIVAIVMQFTAKFFQPIYSEKESRPVLNDQMQLGKSFDSIIEVISQPGITKEDINSIISKGCTSLPSIEWNLPGISKEAIPNVYKICLETIPNNQFVEKDESELIIDQNARAGIYIIYATPLNGINYNSTPIRRIFCRPRPFCLS